MTTAVILDDFKGSGALAGTSPGTLTGVAAAAWSVSGAGVFSRSSSGGLVVMPSGGASVTARLNTDGSSPLHTSAGGGVTVLEISMLPGSFMAISLDFDEVILGIAIEANGTTDIQTGPASFASGASVAAFTGMAVLRVEVTTTAVRYYANGTLIYTRGTGVASGTVITSLQVGWPGIGVTGYPSGSSQLALGYLHLKTETTSGPISPAGQPAVTANSDPKVLFSDTFKTPMNLAGSHGESGPLGTALWETRERVDDFAPLSEYSYSGAETRQHWTRSASGLTVQGFRRGGSLHETTLDAYCQAPPLPARFTDLPVVIEAVAPAGGQNVSVFVSLRANTKYQDFIGVSLGSTEEGGVSLWCLDGSDVDGQASFTSFAFAPGAGGAGGLSFRCELWPGHARAYVGGNLVSVVEMDTSGLVRTDGKVEVLAWGLGTYLFGSAAVIGDATITFGTGLRETPAMNGPRPILKKFALSGMQESSGQLPVGPVGLAASGPPGPGNEPADNSFASFWSSFNKTYEVP